jgi:hypothetical protein
MPQVSVRTRVPGGDRRDVLARTVDFARWPEMSDSVLSVRVERDGGSTSTSWWEVTFREGILKWSQRDEADLDAGVVKFDLIEGDPLTFRGTWRADALGDDCALTLDAEFDLGMPSLGHVLDPMAVEALEDAVASVSRGLFGDEVDIEFGSPTTEGAG